MKRGLAGMIYLSYICTRNSAKGELSSVGSERLPYKQRVGGSNPSAPTTENQRLTAMWVVFLLCASVVGLHVFCPFVLTNVSTNMTHEGKHRGHLLQVQTAQRRNASFNAPSDERPQTQIRFARPFPVRKVLGFRERQAQTELSQQGAN